MKATGLMMPCMALAFTTMQMAMFIEESGKRIDIRELARCSLAMGHFTRGSGEIIRLRAMAC